MHALIAGAVVVMCKNALTHTRTLRIQGALLITIDTHTHAHVLLDETIDKQPASPSNAPSNEVRLLSCLCCHDIFC